MNSPNAGWLFYKKYFFHLNHGGKPDNKVAKEINASLLSTQKVAYPFPTGAFSFCLKTLYPGLVIGTGYNHTMKKFDENFDFGFYFDHTTGMPVIPGSSVKGVLRSLFGQNRNETHKEAKEKMIRDTLATVGLLDVNLGALVNEIFEGIDLHRQAIPPYRRDIFYDAYVVDTEGALFADDYITPHKDPLTDPDPNKMLKVAPGVTFCFSFDLHDGMIRKEIKRDLFEALLLFHGVGAKTNVGYGQFEAVRCAKR